MAIPFLTSIDLNRLELLNHRVQNLATAPADPVKGLFYFNTADNVLYVWNGTAWSSASGYVHPTDGGGSISTALTGAYVISKLVVNSLGHVTETATRQLTASDVGAMASGYAPSLGEVLTALTGTSAVPVSNEILLGDGADYMRTVLTAGTNVSIVNNAGVLTISATDTNTTYSVSGDILEMATTTISHKTSDGYIHVPATGTSSNGKVLKAGATAGSFSWAALAASDVGLGNVTNDAQVKKIASSTSGYVPTWDGADGNLLATGYAVETTLTGSSSALARADAIKTYIDNLLGTNDAMVFKGTLGTGGTITALPTTYSAGWTYKVITAGTYASKVCEVGDMIIAITDRAGSGNLDADWVVVQTNLEAATATPLADSSTGAVGTSLKFAREDHVHPASSVKYSATITGGTTSEVITHNLGTRDVVVQLYNASTYETVYCDVARTSTNSVTLGFATAPAAGAYRVVITG